MDITKVVIPAAGMDTEFLPATKTVPREMLPLLQKPALHYVVDEALSSEVANISIVLGKNKGVIADYFDSCLTLDSFLCERDKTALLGDVYKILRNVEFSYMRQTEQLGSGHAVWLARHTIYKEYFGIMMPDDIIISKTPALAQLIRVARQEKGSVIAVQEVPAECVHRYGMVQVKKRITPNLFQLSNIVEKPHAKDAPSNMAVVGRYILSHKLFAALDELKYESERGMCLTDAINMMLRKGEKVFAYKINGIRYDMSTPLGWIKAVIGCALQDPRYAKQILDFLGTFKSADSFLYNAAKTIEHQL